MSVYKIKRFAEQLSWAALSISNLDVGYFIVGFFCETPHYLHIANPLLFEIANIFVVLEREKYISYIGLNDYLEDLDKLARKLTKFKKYLLK